MSVRDIIQAAAGAGQDKLYVDDVMSTYLYTSASTPQTIDNGIDLAGEGGLIWEKTRAITFDHQLVDTARGLNNALSSNLTNAQFFGGVRTALSNGYTQSLWTPGNTIASWTFRKAPKFFDVVTYTGDGTAARTVAHNLGSVPGMIIVKSTNATGNWLVYHVGMGNTGVMFLNTTNGNLGPATSWNSTSPTSTVFTVHGPSNDVNINGTTYVAYLFAHDAGGFGDSGTDNIVSCGSYVGNGSTNGPDISLGYEPQWLLIKNATESNAWQLHDVMRGMSLTEQVRLFPNDSQGDSSSNIFSINATGFKIIQTTFAYNKSGNTFIYLAIRRPNKPPTSGTQVFAQTSSTSGSVSSSFSQMYADTAITSKRGLNAPSTVGFVFNDRLRGLAQASGLTTPTLLSNSTAAEASTTVNNPSFSDNALAAYVYENYLVVPQQGNGGTISYFLRRAPGFFDVVCYTGNGTFSNTGRFHNLTVAPQLAITKSRSASADWRAAYNINGSSGFMSLNKTDGSGGASGSVGNATLFEPFLDTNGVNYVIYLFATLAGISKVGIYTGTGTTLQINCGFTTGARFVLIKRTDSTGSWYVWDTARGIIAGNDPYLLLNSTAAEVTNTDYIDPLASGFEISSTAPAEINANGGSYIFLAVA
jgi:hypothetical protein